MDTLKVKEALYILERYDPSIKLKVAKDEDTLILTGLTVTEFENMRSTAGKALQKQIPKATTETQSVADIQYICPDCECLNGLRFKYCWNCGQSIKNIKGW